MDATSYPMTNIRKTDIVLILKPMEGKKALSGTGIVDQSLFTGDNHLHAKLDPQTCLWYPEMDKGVLPPQLKQRFTSFSKLYDFVKTYYGRRNIELVEVLD